MSSNVKSQIPKTAISSEKSGSVSTISPEKSGNSSIISYTALVISIIAIIIAIILGIIYLIFKDNDTGPQGSKGDTGAQGPKGDTGPQGPAGDSDINVTQVVEFSINNSGIFTTSTPATPGSLLYVNTNKNYGAVSIDTVSFNLGASFKVIAMKPFYIQGANINISTYSTNVSGTGNDTSLGKALCPNQAVDNNTFFFPLGFVYEFTRVYGTSFTMSRTANVYLPTNIFQYSNTSDQVTPSYLRLTDSSDTSSNSIYLTDNGWYSRNIGPNKAVFLLNYNYLFPGDTWHFDTSTGNMGYYIRWDQPMVNAGYRIGILNKSINTGNIDFVDEIDINQQSSNNKVLKFRVAAIHHPPILLDDSNGDIGYILLTQYIEVKPSDPIQ